MPQSLTIGTSSLSGSVKRQRSADSRNVHSQSTSGGLRDSYTGQLRSNTRIPPYLEKSKTEIALAFQDLEWKQRFRLFHAMENPQTSPFRVDRSDIVISRNRYANVQPWDQSRVKLTSPIAGSDYVNASPIILKSFESSSKDDLYEKEEKLHEAKYIATQGPKAGQFASFWHMVMQETIGDEGVIVMLTQCYEANKEKCAQYFPGTEKDSVIQFTFEENESRMDSIKHEHNPQSPTISASTSQDTVKLISISHDAATGSEIRVLNLSIGGMTKKIHHFLFKGWPDFGRPDGENRVALLELVRTTRQIAQESPRIVHCSAGVGRTGTFIATDFLIREIEEGRIIDPNAYRPLKSPTYFPHQNRQTSNSGASSNIEKETWGKSGPAKVITPTTEDFDVEDKNSYNDDLIYNTVNALREQRMMMVVNELQYALLYEVAREVFWDKYRARQEGPTIKGNQTDSNLPKTKVAKVEDGAENNTASMDLGGGGGGSGSVSEAETEIMEQNNMASKDNAHVSVKDPYAAVAPMQLREGTGKQQEQEL